MAVAVGTKAQARYVRMSASKARVVLNLIRGENVARADEILEFSDRGSAVVIRKVLASAIANAENNDAQVAEELFVSACFADEGPTIKRWRPRARGRATRIMKRTCHITVVVERLSVEELELATMRAEAKGSTTDASTSRRRRVAKSKPAQEEPMNEEVVDEAVTDEVTEVEVAAEVAEAAAETDAEDSQDTPEKED